MVSSPTEGEINASVELETQAEVKLYKKETGDMGS